MPERPLRVAARRRATAREFPDAEPGDALATVPAAAVGLRRGPAAQASAERESLALLHAEGALNDAEYVTAKARVLGS